MTARHTGGTIALAGLESLNAYQKIERDAESLGSEGRNSLRQTSFERGTSGPTGS